MIGLVFSKFWDTYYASSPYLNLLRSSHPRFEILSYAPHEIVQSPELQEKINQYEALVVDDVMSPVVSFYRNGPRFMIGGDLHAHNDQSVQIRTRELTENDYVFSGGIFSPKLPQYKYFDDSLRSKMLYLPNSVPDIGHKPKLQTWENRIPKALLSGSVSKEVYPFRYEVRRQGSGVDVLPPGGPRHGDYFISLGAYQAAVTCDSVLRYVVAKYFEIPWLGMVLIATPPQQVEQELLGMRNKDNVVWANKAYEVPIILQEMQGFPDIYSLIAKCGSAWADKHHTARRRLHYIASVVDAIKKGSFAPDDALQIFKAQMESLT